MTRYLICAVQQLLLIVRFGDRRNRLATATLCLGITLASTCARASGIPFFQFRSEVLGGNCAI